MFSYRQQPVYPHRPILTRTEQSAMIPAPSVVPATTAAMNLPMMFTVALASIALVMIAVYVRRARRAGRLNHVTALASGVSAAGILVSALAVTLIVGGATAASAAPPTSTLSRVFPVTSSISNLTTFPAGYEVAAR